MHLTISHEVESCVSSRPTYLFQQFMTRLTIQGRSQDFREGGAYIERWLLDQTDQPRSEIFEPEAGSLLAQFQLIIV